MRPYARLWCGIVAGLLAGMLLIGLYGAPALAQSGDDPPPMQDIRDRLAPPPLSEPPTTFEQGHYDYYLYCMVCHGDRGQGLTEEWRNAGDPADANCWQSRCHASNHPPGGFELPRFAPPVIGEYALTRFATVGELQQYIQQSMPWHMPGLLEEEQYRRIALYLAQANSAPGLDPTAPWEQLSAQPASSRAASAQPADIVALDDPPRADLWTTIGLWTGVLMLGLLIAALAIYGAKQRSG